MSRIALLLGMAALFITGCAVPAATPTARTATAVRTSVAISVAGPSATASPTPTPVDLNEVIPDETKDTSFLPLIVTPEVRLEEVIAYEMKGSFDFFWEQANTHANSPGFGLIRDRYPGSEGIASIAAVGFGLTAYPVGVEKGFITYQEGYDRAIGTLETLLAMERVEGFYYHFVDMETGERAWESEVSTIDTAILLMGVLTAGEYFGGEVQDRAEQIYDGVNWPWFVDESRDMFYMAYRPEEGFAGYWDFYAEQLMLYVLAAGSDTYPVDETTYYAFTRHAANYGDGQPFIHSWFGSIFTYQFSHAWIDFRQYTDREGVNWFDNSLEASLAQVNFAVDMDDEYVTLGPNAWGLTASDGPQGYNGLYGAPPSGFDNQAHFIDDTIPPSGAIGSIIFLPEQVALALLNYNSIEPLKSEYGFLDAYNLTEAWYASDVIGIDKGISLLMLANYESDLVYQIAMSNQQILNGLARLQITKNDQ